MEDILNNTWLVTIVGGTISTVVGGIIVAFFTESGFRGGSDIDIGGCLSLLLLLLFFGAVMAIVSALVAIGYQVILGVLLLFARTFDTIPFLTTVPWDALFTLLAITLAAGLWLYLAIMIFSGLIGNRQ